MPEETANPNAAKMKKAELAERLMPRFEAAETILKEIIPSFQLLTSYCRPSRDVINNAYGANSHSGSNTARVMQHMWRLYDSKMIRANLQHASGVMAWMSPPTTQWFQLRPPPGLAGDEEVEAWHNSVTEAMRSIMAVSNFSAENHEAILDGGCAGPRALTALEGNEPGNPVIYKALEPGSYAMEENAVTGRIDCFYQTVKYTPRQASQKFGAENLPDKVQTKLKDIGKHNGDADKEEYIQCVYPREDYERDKSKIDTGNLPVGSVWMHRESKTVVSVGGFMEFPGAFSRYLKWGASCYGYSPAMLAIADGRQLNELQHMLDILAEVKARPRVLAPDYMEDSAVTFDLRPGGVTYYPNKGNNQAPVSTWGTEGDYALGVERVKHRERVIDEAFHLDVFNAFRDITKEITATEAEMIREEAITSFSPTFALMGSEHYQPILMRTFAILLRKSLLAHQMGDASRMYFPLPPKKMLVDMGNGRAELPAPSVTFVSRMAYRLNQVHNVAARDALQRRMEIAQATGDPSVMDDLNLPKMLGELERDAGLPERWRYTPEEVDQIKQARAQQQQMQAAAEMAEKGSKAVANLSKAGAAAAA